MNKFNRWLSTLLCLCMLCTSALSALAEGEADYEVVIEPIETEAPSEVLELGGDAPEASDSAAVAAQPEEAAFNYAEDAAAQPDFAFGYAQLANGALLYADADSDAVAQLGGGVALAVERSSDRLRIAFVFEDAVVEGWTDARSLRPMSPDEVADFQSGIMEAYCYQDNVEYPLGELTMTALVPEVEATEAPAEVLPTVEATEAPAEVLPTVEATEAPAEVLPTVEATEAPAEVLPTVAPMEAPAELPSVQPAGVDVEPAAESVTMALVPMELSLQVGERAQIAAEFSDGQTYPLTYALLTSGIVSVDNEGVVTAMSAGTAQVAVRCVALGLSGTVTVTVAEAAQNAAPQPENAVPETVEVELVVGESVDLGGERAVYAIEGSDSPLVYVSENNQIASVDDDGVVTAVAEGSCTIIAYASEQPVARYDVTVRAAVNASLSAALELETLDVGETTRMIVLDGSAAAEQVTYRTSDEAVATVDADGVVTAVGKGVCDIIAVVGDAQVDCALTVYALPDRFEASLPSKEMFVGEAAKVTLALPEYTRGEAEYATLNGKVTVDGEGNVEAVATGVDSIIITIGQATAAIDVTVYDEPEIFELTLEADRLAVGAQTRASVVLPEFTRTEIEYSSSDAKVAVVDEDGVVTAVGAGDCRIGATSREGVTVSVSLEVYAPSVQLNQSQVGLAVGDEFLLSYTIIDEGLAPNDVAYESSDAQVASVDADTGLVRALREGAATISLKFGDMTVATCEVSVVDGPAEIAFGSELMRVLTGHEFALPLEAKNAEGESMVAQAVYESSDTRVVAVNEEGKAVGLKSGWATVTARTANGLTASILIGVHASVNKVEIEPESLTLGEGMSERLTARVYYTNSAYMEPSDDDMAGTGEYRTSDPGVAEVDAYGNVRGVSKGTATITFRRMDNGAEAECAVVVVGKPTELHLNAEKVELSEGASYELKATFGAGETGEAKYESANEEVATVDENGVVRAVGEGVTTITAKAEGSEGELTATCEVTVVGAPAEIAFGSELMRVLTGHEFELPLEAKNAEGESMVAQAVYESSDTRVVAVNEEGKAVGLKSGWATVTARTANGLTASILIGVHASVNKVEIEPESLTLGEGMSERLTARVYYTNSAYMEPSDDDMAGTGEYRTSDPEVAEVDAYGNVRGVSKGTATITFRRMDNGAEAECAVVVVGKPTELHLNAEKVELSEGASYELKATFGAGETGEAKYESANEEVATVDENGVVRAVSEGVTTITAKAEGSEGELTATCEVTVVGAPAEIAFGSELMRVLTGHEFELPLEAKNAEGESMVAQAVYESSDTRVVAVNEEGKAVGLKSGWATVTARTANGLTASILIGVHASVNKVEIEPESLTLGEGMSERLTARVYYTNSAYMEPSDDDMAGTGEYRTSDPEVAEVDAYGNVRGVSKGTATITFRRMDNGAEAECAVVVVGKPTELHLNAEKVELSEGASYELKATFGAGETGEAKYESANEEVATVDENGVVRAVSEGVTTITAKAEGSEGELTATCEVTVVGAPAEIAFGSELMRVLTGHEFALPLEAKNAEGESMVAQAVYESSDTRVVAVNEEGKAVGLKSGWATVTARTANGLTASILIGVHASVNKVEIEPESLTLGEGMSERLTARVYYTNSAYMEPSDDDMAGTGEYRTSDPRVAEVDAYGNVRGVSKGTATITFRRMDNGAEAECAVVVVGKPTAIYLDKSEATLGVGMEMTLTASFNEGELGKATFSSSDSDVATVDADGKVTAVAVGTALIRAEAYNGLHTFCRVDVVAAPDKVTLDITSSNLSIGGTIKLTPTATMTDGSECLATFAFASSNTSVATVDAQGNVRGVRAGEAIIRVFTQNGLYADCNVVVRPAATSVRLSTSALSLGVGERETLQAEVSYRNGSFVLTGSDTSYARFESSAPEIASVDPATGEITGRSVGSATVRVYTYNGKSASCAVTVVEGPEWIRFTQPMLGLSVGQSYTLECEMSAGSLATRTYETSDPDVIEVVGNDATCEVRAVGVGSAVVTATSSNGRQATCEITVLAAPQRVTFAEDSVAIGLDETVQLPKVTVSSDEGECAQQVTYTADNDNIRVTSTGIVTGLQAGTSVVTATTYNGVSDTCTVRVLPAPSFVEVSVEHAQIAVGDETRVNVQMDASGNYTLTVEPEGIVEIDVEGNARALAAGTAVITATTYNGIEDSCTLQVLDVPASVNVEPKTLSLGVGMSQVLRTSIPEGTLGTVTFESTDPEVAEVTSEGVVSAKAPGKAQIIASIAGHDDVFDACELTVLPMPTKVELSDAELSLKVGATAALIATVTNDGGETCYGGVTFESSDPRVVEVDADGTLHAIAEGSATVTATAEADPDLTAACSVTVADAMIRLDVEAISLGEGETYALQLVMPDGRKDDFSIESTAPEFATVTDEGVITALKVGEAEIRATNGGETAVCKVTVCARPTAIELNQTEKRLVVGESFQLGATLQPEGAASALIYRTANPEVAQVSPDGTVTAVGYGATTITVETYDSEVYAACRVTAVYEPETVRFGELEVIVIAVGDRYVLQPPVMYNPNGVCDATYTLTITNTDCAQIALSDGQYVIEALAEGEATLRLRTSNGKTDSHKVIVVGAPESIRFSETEIFMGVGESYAPSLVADNDATVSVTFASDDPSIVRAEGNQLYAVGEGTATVTATAVTNEALTAQVEVTVLAEPTRMWFSENEMTIAVGDLDRLVPQFDEGEAAANVSFTSSDEDVVRVDQRGLVSGVSLGDAVIRAVAYNGVEAECAVSVRNAPTQMSVFPQSITACLADSVQLQVTFASDDEYADVMFDTSDPEVAEVTEDGLVTFNKIGTATIYVESFNGLSAEVPVEVCETPTSVAFTLNSVVILNGDRAKLDVVFDKGAGYYTLESSSPSVVRVAEDGCIEALSIGSAAITLKMPGTGLEAMCLVRVIDKLDGIVVVPVDEEIEIDGQTELTYTLFPINAVGTGLVRFDSLNPDIATVDPETGVVTGVASGTATLTATAGDGTSSSCEVRVLGGAYRIFAACYSGEPSDKGSVGYLPFTKNNAFSMLEAFGGATVDGQTYAVSALNSNLPKSTLLGSISSFFADATENDVSVIYLTVHGGYDSSTNQYAFWLNESTAVYGDELMDRVEAIKGKVIVIMDSCYSGGLLRDVSSRLSANSDRIAVLTSSHETTSSCYWSVSNTTQSVDFFTFALLEGLAYNEADGLSGMSHGFQDMAVEPADADGDGNVTLQELFNYASSRTVSLIAAVKNDSRFRGNPAQVPNSFISSEMADLVVFSR